MADSLKINAKFVFRRFNGAIVAIDDGVQEGVLQVHAGAIRSLYSHGRKLWKERTNVSPYARFDRSDARGFHRRTRATGRFKFGSGQAFQARTINENNIQGFGWDLDQADLITDRAWRVQEFGIARVKMPRGVWLNAAGKRGPAGDAAFTRFSPAKPGKEPTKGKRKRARKDEEVRRPFWLSTNPVIGKKVLQDSIKIVAEELPRDYRIMINKVFDKSKKFL